MVNSQELYDKFAPHFREYSRKKNTYIASIDELILANLPQERRNFLDVGCGDGVRGARLFNRIKGEKMLMIDNSRKMVSLAKELANQRIVVMQLDISCQKLKMKDQFDIILCLWNVLGHIPNARKRLISLRNMRELLRDNGKIFLDISNRYNIRHYGFRKVVSNIIKDVLQPNVRNGDFNYTITVDKSKKLNSSCHFFSPFEMKTLIKQADLQVEGEYSIDYATGRQRRTFFEGHLFYILRKSTQ